MITREKAADVLYELINAGVLDRELTSSLEDIARGISEEQYGRHVWGSEEDDWVKLHVAYRSDLMTDELVNELQAIDQKYSFIPAPYEAENLIENGEGDEPN